MYLVKNKSIHSTQVQNESLSPDPRLLLDTPLHQSSQFLAYVTQKRSDLGPLPTHSQL